MRSWDLQQDLHMHQECNMKLNKVFAFLYWIRDASITAKTYFQQHGYQIVQSQSVERTGIMLVNFKIIKKLNKPALDKNKLE
ncbi:hypothetical protein [Bacillus sp. T33-2]|uniref:hypothetical protein n=1 Tax=Bacillus sp. T33-2 TaxID=2054168 RepID=UPI000C777CC2|nr:hypothetical protein [Bacillus sp. T33-2]PLR98437.1 hypothetical protein CVD19_04970 [Bacillus sp. T33-2]